MVSNEIARCTENLTGPSDSAIGICFFQFSESVPRGEAS